MYWKGRKCFPSFCISAFPHENRRCLKEHERFVNKKNQLLVKQAIFFFWCEFRIYQSRKVKPVKLHRATFESLHPRRFNLCPAHCQPLTRLRVLSVLPSLTSLPLKSSRSRTRLHLKQVNTHTLTPSRILTGCESMTRSPLSEYQSAASLSMSASHPGGMWWELMGDSQTGMPWAELDSLCHHSMLPLILFGLLRFCLLLKMLEKCCLLQMVPTFDGKKAV